MTVSSNGEEKVKEGSISEVSNSDVEKISNGTNETEPQTEAQSDVERVMAPSISFSLPPPTSQEAPRECAMERRGGHIESVYDAQSRRTSYKTKSGVTQGSKRLSSLEMRRLPVDVLLKPEIGDNESVLSDDFHAGPKKKETVGAKKGILHLLCLRPGYSLRTQLLSSFGSLSAITIVAVVTTCIIVAHASGANVKETNENAFAKVAAETQRLTARYLAEQLSEKLILTDAVRLLYEATRDRFAGYPSASDDNVPFKDSVTGEQIYPINFPPLPLEWSLEANVNQGNYDEHFHGQDYFRTRPVSTASCSFLMKGICDPDETDPNGDSYWENCTDANNDITTGGVLEPTNTTELIYSKGKDLVPLIKAIHESRGVIRDVGIFFANDGAGASINYPHYRISTQATYPSTGCEWMNTPNFYDPSRTIGSQEMIDRCSPEGEVVSSRIYSPVERGWCVDQALNPDRIRFDSGRDAWDNTSWLLTMGRAVYDRITNDFVACTYVGISLFLLDEELREAVVVKGEKIALVKLDVNGTVVGSSMQEDRNEVDSSSYIYNVDFDITRDDYDELYNLVEFSVKWEPAAVKQKYSEFAVQGSNFFVTAYPVPPIPREYDETYEPLFLVFVATPNEFVFSAVEDARQVVDDRVRKVTVFSVAAGAIGLIISLITIYVMADMLTKPLRKMNKVASEIVSNFGDPTKENAIGTENDPVSKEASCTPKTELSDVVEEFNKMVESFSGTSMVKTQRHKSHEVYNMFALHRDFTKLYKSRAESGFKYAVNDTAFPEEDTAADDESIAFVNCGTNMIDDHDTFTTGRSAPNPSKGVRFSSPLFLWIVALIVTPLLVVNVIITAVSLSTVSREFIESVELAEDSFFDVQKTKLEVHSGLRADLAAALTARATNDLHVMARYANWLMFGGVNTSDSFTQMSSGIEECKSFSDTLECPFVQDNLVCDCAWNDDRIGTCQAYPEDTRQLQELFWVCQSDSASPNGDRFTNSYPDVANSPDTTEWWDDQLQVPGFDTAQNGTRFDSTFARLKTASSIPIFQPIYNYHEVKEDTLAAYVAYEADGMFVGYDGCTTSLHVDLSGFESTVENEAASLRPEICPLGKFGYDPRCRRWYEDGRQGAINDQSFLHVTAPYQFATSGQAVAFAQSATAPLVDPKSGKHHGQVLLDFLPTRMIRSVSQETKLEDGGFPFLVSAGVGPEADTVIGPGYGVDDPPTSISNLILPYDKDCSTGVCTSHIEAFGKIVMDMKSGGTGNATFERSGENGVPETILLSYNPVRILGFRPVDSSDFSRGLVATNYVIYSLALAESENGILEAFEPIKEVTNQQIAIAIGVASVLLLFAAVLVVYISLRVTESIAEPMVYLLQLIRSIRKCDNDDPPDLRNVKASNEIIAFSDSIEMLSQVVHSANTAFYAGEFEMAYYVLADALRLFRRLDNKKAIGIACNNLGNVMMGLYQEMTKDNEKKLAGLTKKQIITKGISYYHEAIQLGEKAYDEFYNLHGWTPICLDFMQHLSNRYFNRGLFLLCVKDDHEKPVEMEDLGRRDLQIAADMDSEVVAYGEDLGWDSYNRTEKIFNVMIVRLGGYNLLLETGYEDTWEVDALIDETFEIIRTERKKENSDLFERVTYTGRLQEVETELMKYYQSQGDIETAARIAVRCLHEDEKVFVDAEARAISVIGQYIDKTTDMSDSSRSCLKNTLDDYADMLEDAIRHQTESSINEMESDVLTKATGGSGKDSKRFSSTNWSMQQSSGRFVTMEDF